MCITAFLAKIMMWQSPAAIKMLKSNFFLKVCSPFLTSPSSLRKPAAKDTSSACWSSTFRSLDFEQLTIFRTCCNFRQSSLSCRLSLSAVGYHELLHRDCDKTKSDFFLVRYTCKTNVSFQLRQSLTSSFDVCDVWTWLISQIGIFSLLIKKARNTYRT